MRRVRLAIQDDVTEEIQKKKALYLTMKIGDRIGKVVLHFHGTKWAQSTAKVEFLIYAFAEDDAAYTVAWSASSFAFLQ